MAKLQPSKPLLIYENPSGEPTLHPRLWCLYVVPEVGEGVERRVTVDLASFSAFATGSSQEKRDASHQVLLGSTWYAVNLHDHWGVLLENWSTFTRR